MPEIDGDARPGPVVWARPSVRTIIYPVTNPRNARARYARAEAGMTTGGGDRWSSGNAYESYGGRWSRLVAPELLAWLDVPPGRRWLDVGCGTDALRDRLRASVPAGPDGSIRLIARAWAARGHRSSRPTAHARSSAERA